MEILHDIFICFCYVVGILAMVGILFGLLGGLFALGKKNKG